MKRKMLSVTEDIHYRAKLEALKRGISLKDLTNQAITEYLDKRNGSDARKEREA